MKMPKQLRIKKSQMKMAETVMVLLAFFILLIIGLVIYAAYQKTSMRRTATETFEREAVKIALKTAFYPEFACTDGGVINENCFDLHKLRAYKEKIDNRINEPEFFLFYETELRDSRIKVKSIFPPDSAEEINLYDNLPVETDPVTGEEVIKNGKVIPTFIPVTIRNDLRDKNRRDSLGMLVVESYRQTG